ncbi:5-(carboxyamino)imidazole ribonucleotide synthase [Phaeocystidibacter luteus]|uniref:N5-carboxyaminoimidazole ribonucleotide synthase n=1 Tax=Phaeocystidibacter luteus TaxID=911197 RepID=A0A6N6RJ05_9FLAO|nr:5-(carboxyamino)imidazole ribonucleotide synthase [Phaeocystidibacter luteus]KAB2810301.1 5-(carboxyamino)imidazole ribonucleotide synthase [Phaeocystidibacter luteus]
MKEIFSNPNFKLGVLGGGQLGKMMLQETRRYDIYTKVIDPAADAPSRLASNEFVQGSLTDYNTVMEFGRGLDVLTIEIEHVNVDALEDLQKQGVKVFPQPSALRIIQNKADQKEFYQTKGLPTSKFFTFKNKAEMLEGLKDGNWKPPFVWKAATGGYDGFGVNIVKDAAQIESLPDQAGLVEAFVPFEKELAVIVARNEHGQTVTYPVVEMEFHPTANQVEYVLCPATVSPEAEEKARKLAVDAIEAFDLVGLLAVEMFLSKDGEVYINEVAPRTHNSGHLTIESNFTSQFEQHVRAVTGMPLGSTELRLPAVMANLVGETGYSGPVRYDGYENLLSMPGVYIHLYGKSSTRPFRKMGHVTVTNADRSEARKAAEQAKSAIKVISRS